MKHSLSIAGPLAVLLLSACSGGAGGGSGNTPPTGNANMAPTITGLGAKQGVPQDGSSDPIAFEIGDAESAAEELSVDVSSSNEELMPVAGIQLAGNGSARALLLTPEPGASGRATLSVSVRDPHGLETVKTLALEVTSREASFREFALAQFDVTADAEPAEVAGHRWVETAEDDPAAFDSVLTPIGE